MLESEDDSFDFDSKDSSTGYLKNIDGQLLCATIENLDRDFEAPVRLFSLLKKDLLIEKGAILLYESEQESFLPWGITGFDETTQHRLRIPGNLIQDIIEKNLSSRFFIDTDGKNRLKPFFSIREFSMLDSLLVFPFFSEDALIALLLITESPICSETADTLKTLHDTIHTAVVFLLVSSRVQRLKKLQGKIAVEDNITIEHEVRNLAERADAHQKQLLLVLFSAGVLIEHIIGSISDAQPYRIKQDIRRILSSMVPDEGAVFRLKGDRFLLCFLAKTTPNPKLLVYQISLALRQFFSDLSDVPDVEYKAKQYPVDGDNILNLLHEVQQTSQ